MRRRPFFLLLALLVAAPGLRAQTVSLLREGDRLHRTYHFEEALAVYARASASTADADSVRLLRTRMERALGALDMTDGCEDPVVVARERFSRNDFFLFYPLRNQTWRETPNVLDDGDGFPTYAPQGARDLLFSAPGPAGGRNLYFTRNRDTLWSAPELLDERLSSLGNEVFPMLSEDGKTLTFASDGLPGMGGYDLYTATWDEEAGRWGEPVNRGFPYSSTGDDFLLVETPDGKYTLFASNRDCSRDSVYIYVLEKQPVPWFVSLQDPSERAQAAALLPLEDPTRQDHGSAVQEQAPENDDTRMYRQKMAEARFFRDSIYTCERRLDSLRMKLSAGGGDDRTALTSAIADGEAALSPLRERLEKTSQAVRRIEESFLRRGVVSDTDPADQEVVGARSSYTFSKKSFGAKLRLKFTTPRTGI